MAKTDQERIATLENAVRVLIDQVELTANAAARSPTVAPLTSDGFDASVWGRMTSQERRLYLIRQSDEKKLADEVRIREENSRNEHKKLRADMDAMEHRLNGLVRAIPRLDK
jgi:hypothetical protein